MRLLPPVTKKYTDRSTDGFFQFEFYCDRCGTTWKSDEYPFYMRNAECNSEGEKRAKEILWRADHDAAYERANNEAALNFNKCHNCKLRVCDECFSEFEAVCKTCEKKS